MAGVMRTKQDRMSAIFGILSQPIKKASGWRRAMIAFVAGAVSALALPPFDLWPILFVTFPVLVWLTDGIATASFGAPALNYGPLPEHGAATGGVPSFLDRRKLGNPNDPGSAAHRSASLHAALRPGNAMRFGGAFAAAWIGWCFGFGYFLGGLYWFGYAYHYLVDTAALGWLLPFAVMIIPAYISIYPALGLSLARLYWPRGPARIVSLAVAMTIAEWLRGHLITDFPWNAFGYALTGPLVLAQGAAWIGIWGLTFFTVIVFAAPAVLADDPLITRRRWIPSAVSLVLLGTFAVCGALRLSHHPTAYVASVRLRVVQPNLRPYEQEYNVTILKSMLNHYRALSGAVTQVRPQGLSQVTHLIWPAGALQFYLFPPQIVNFLPSGTTLITGSVRLAARGPNSRDNPDYNSAFVVDHDGNVLSFYDKIHLVPWGEYLPGQTWLENFGLTRYIKTSGGLSRGGSRHNLTAPGAPDFLPLICYEVIFPDEVAPQGNRPAWILNLTNDSWFGDSSGPFQHFQQARVRAIEQGLPLVRAANTGISAIVDPLGRIIESLPPDTEGVIDGELPREIPPTLYATYGDGILAAMLSISLLVMGLAHVWRRV
jgi:apolipoprotein N-acyltransferase